MTEPSDDRLDDLIDRLADGRLDAGELAEIESRLQSDPATREAYLRRMTLHATLEDAAAEQGSETMAVSAERPQPQRPSSNRRRVLTAAGVVAAVLFAVSLLLSRQAAAPEPTGSPTIATVTAAGGPLEWTGDGGVVSFDLPIGSDVTGGTINSRGPDAWFEVTFRDGSRVRVLGDSQLTLSDLGQKRLRMRRGRLWADVVPQPSGRPMRIDTDAAIVRAGEAAFSLEADRIGSVLDVTGGQIAISGLDETDQKTVASGERATASLAPMSETIAVARRPDSVAVWASPIARSPAGTYGHWTQPTDDRAARLAAIPYRIRRPDGGEDLVVHTVGFDVAHGGHAPLRLNADSALRLRGEADRRGELYVGLTMQSDGGESVNYQVRIPAESLQPTGDGAGFGFDIRVAAADLRPTPEHAGDPSVPPSVLGRPVTALWCHSLTTPIGLQILAAEIGPDDGLVTLAGR